MAVGRPALKTPDHPLYAAVASARQLALTLGVKHQQLSQWANGAQWVPLTVVRRVEEITKGAVRLGHWAKVRDRETGQYWEHGVASAGPWGKEQAPDAA